MTATGSSPKSLSEQADEVRRQFESRRDETREAPSPEAVESLRVAFLGRKGAVTALLDGLKQCPKEERPTAGKAVNQLKQDVEKEIEALRAAATEWTIRQELEKPPLDVTLPVDADSPTGSLHPVTLMRRELLDVLRRLGFSVSEGPEMDFEFFNFNALNIPDHHPARDMQDTFYLEERDDLVMRTHTSNCQIHAMLGEKPPLRIVSPGRVFRCDSDPTHTPMFHQIEGFVVDQGISFAHLKGVVDAFLKGVYGKDFKTRFRPSFFPFVEPGAEVDLQCMVCGAEGCRVCKHTGWLEIGGCGMIHPNVFEAVGYDSEVYTGFAFGFGIDRMALLKYQLPDLRELFEGHYGFLGQFPVYP